MTRPEDCKVFALVENIRRGSARAMGCTSIPYRQRFPVICPRRWPTRDVSWVRNDLLVDMRLSQHPGRREHYSYALHCMREDCVNEITLTRYLALGLTRAPARPHSGLNRYGESTRPHSPGGRLSRLGGYNSPRVPSHPSHASAREPAAIRCTVMPRSSCRRTDTLRYRRRQ